MSIDEEREELRKRVEGLNELQAILERVQAHSKYLLSIDAIERNDFQRLWVSAFQGIESSMAAGTEDSLREAALNLASLDRLREMTTNKFMEAAEDDRPRFSFFGRRRR
jgi:hypothetical protein